MYQDAQGKKWWKGNLHTHTTNSDGRKTPEEAIRVYREQGFDFMAITDHWVWSESRFQEGMLVLSGCEYNVGDQMRGESEIYHILSIGGKAPAVVPKNTSLSPQEMLDAIHQVGGFAVLAHPSWSLNRPDRILPLKGIDAVEIYNTLSGTPWNGRRADSSSILDIVSAAGKLLPVVAVDDTHFYTGEQGRSFIWVQAEELTQEAILEALRAGRFYASQGPRLAVSYEGGRILVHSSPVQDVVFYSNQVWASHRTTRGEGLTQVAYTPESSEAFIRVEAVDEAGNMAWTSPVSTELLK